MTRGSDERLLLVLGGEARAGAELPRQGVLTIGSSRERAGFLVEGPGIEGLHCAIGRTKGGGWALKDLGSASGTSLNGQRIQVARLKAGDAIRIGDRELRIQAPEDFAPARAPAAESAPPAFPSLSGYRIERALGRGGMGSVFLAVQTSLDRPVALKVLAGRLAADVEFVRRFQAEARAAAALAHPNVVTVYDVGEEGGVHYLSMEFMDRGTLEERVAGGRRLPWREVLDILRDAALGLVYAEAKRIVHRDLKPANLMQNHVGATKISDLGLATHVEAEERETADRKVFGTPHFMSPEQARGERVDGRSDLYSLGATAYRLLTGHTPFEGTTAREIVRAHLALEPRPMRDFAPDLPDEAVALVARLMRKDPAERFASAAELLKEIDRLRAVPGAASPPRRKSRLALVGIAVLVAAATAAWILEVPGRRPAVPKPLATAAPETPRPPDDPAAVAGTPSPADPSGTPGSPAPPKDDDKELQLLEAKAKIALFELRGKEMTPAEKSAALRALAQEWRGTTAATEAVDKAQEIDEDLATHATADVDQKARIDEVVARLQSAASVEEAPPRPGAVLQKLRAVTGQAAVAGDPAFVSRRKEIERSVISRATAYARARIDETTDLMKKGEFASVESRLTELLPLFELPDFPPGEGPAGVEDLFELGRTARERLKNLELLHGQFVDKQARDDAVTIAGALGGSSGLERELRTLDLAAAKERLAGIQGKLGSPQGRAFVEGLLQDVASSQSALQALGREFASWRRKGFTEVRGGKSLTRNAIGADAEGILADNGSGAVEHVPWSAFGGDDREISKLFTERLTREWTPGELRGIAALLRLTGVVEALGRASKMFDAGKRANFTEADAKEMSECFAQAEIWAEKAGSAELVAKELAAARLLGVACQRMTEAAWSVAASTTEDLLARHADTLLVHLLSDGTMPEAPKEKN